MSTLPTIEEAIRSRTPIRFRYIRDGKTDEIRVGNPHAVYIKRLKNGSENVYVDLWQTDGASDSGQPLPSWRKCFLEGVVDIEVLSEQAPFDECDTYNATSYEFPICIV